MQHVQCLVSQICHVWNWISEKFCIIWTRYWPPTLLLLFSNTFNFFGRLSSPVFCVLIFTWSIRQCTRGSWGLWWSGRTLCKRHHPIKKLLSYFSYKSNEKTAEKSIKEDLCKGKTCILYSINAISPKRISQYACFLSSLEFWCKVKSMEQCAVCLSIPVIWQCKTPSFVIDVMLLAIWILVIEYSP